MVKKTVVAVGVCEFCKDDYEGHPPKQKLYRVGSKKQIMCGDCANEYEGDVRMMNYEGRFDE